jgi:hypothetical protein
MYPHQVVCIRSGSKNTISGLSVAKLSAIKTGYGCVFADEQNVVSRDFPHLGYSLNSTAGSPDSWATAVLNFICYENSFIAILRVIPFILNCFRSF